MAAIHISNDSSIASKISQLRDRSLKPHVVRTLVAEISTALTTTALPSSTSTSTSLTHPASPKIAVIPVLRSGLSMSDPFLDTVDKVSPDTDVVVYHLGLFREKVSLQPVEYYNKLPVKEDRITEAYVVDPLIATGGTAKAVIGVLK